MVKPLKKLELDYLYDENGPNYSCLIRFIRLFISLSVHRE